mgnify:FL=1
MQAQSDLNEEESQRGALDMSNDALAALRAYEEQVRELESEFGPFHSGLLEPLESMEELLAATGSFDRVANLQRRRLQIQRTEFGFESTDLLPLLEGMMTTMLQLGEWQEVTDTLEHIRHLHALNSGPDSDAVLATMARQAQWNLSRVYLDPETDRPSLVLDSREIYDETLDIVKERFGEDSPELVPWLYRRAMSLYYIVAMMNTDNGLAGSTIDEVSLRDGIVKLNTFRGDPVLEVSSVGGRGSQIPVVNEDELVGVAYLREAKGFIADIREIAELSGNLELEGLAEIYEGDFNILMGRVYGLRNSGRGNFRKAREKLLEAGLAAERVDNLFSRPMLLPIPEFFSDFDGLERYQQNLLVNAEPDSADMGPHLGTLLVWDKDLRSISMPLAAEGLAELQIDKHFVDLEFRISSRGEVSSVDVLHAEPDENRVKRVAWRALREISFRPPFVDNRTRTVRDARIRYEFHSRGE